MRARPCVRYNRAAFRSLSGGRKTRAACAPRPPAPSMPFAFLLALAAVAGAGLLTYLYDRDAPFWPRLCAGVCLGFAALGLVGFALASLLGMNAWSVALAGLVCGSPLLLLSRRGWRARAGADVGEGFRALGGALSGKSETAT